MVLKVIVTIGPLWFGLIHAVCAVEKATVPATSDLQWLTEYSTGLQRAVAQQKMMLAYFRDPSPDRQQNRFETKTLSDPAVRQKLADYVLVKLPTSATGRVKGKDIRLLDHGAFRYMYGRSGLAIIDFKHKDKPYYGYVVSCFPFDPPAYYCPSYESAASVRVILDLPPGTITQRTMIYAVRMHPESPASTNGTPHPDLLSAAQEHSGHQARIGLQGHHGWEYRSQQIGSRLGAAGSLSEVCAESWPHSSRLVTACIDCVHSWRQSSGHWSAVRALQRVFGYDIRRGSNGIWYATGIFGR